VSPRVGVRNTSERRFSRKGQAARAPIGSQPTLKPIDTAAGPLAFRGEGAVVCPECLTGLDPAKLKDGETVPKHARYGHRTNARGNPPCRGWIAQLTPGGGE
jgi:hypothetical protein